MVCRMLGVSVLRIVSLQRFPSRPVSQSDVIEVMVRSGGDDHEEGMVVMLPAPQPLRFGPLPGGTKSQAFSYSPKSSTW